MKSPFAEDSRGDIQPTEKPTDLELKAGKEGAARIIPYVLAAFYVGAVYLVRVVWHEQRFKIFLAEMVLGAAILLWGLYVYKHRSKSKGIDSH